MHTLKASNLPAVAVCAACKLSEAINSAHASRTGQQQETGSSAGTQLQPSAQCTARQTSQHAQQFFGPLLSAFQFAEELCAHQQDPSTATAAVNTGQHKPQESSTQPQ